MSNNKDPLVGRLTKSDHVIMMASIAGVPAPVISPLTHIYFLKLRFTVTCDNLEVISQH